MVNYALVSAVFLGISPAFLWLIFFLKKDKHPEPKKTIVEVFLWGMIFALFALYFISFIQPYLISFVFLSILIFASLEELTKYFTVRFSVFKNPELDEPVDFMIYLITAALGFVAMENILISFHGFLIKPDYFFQSMFLLNVFRFLGATFLHALVSGIFGYFLALSFYYSKKRIMLIGFSIATILHVLFNLVMIKLITSSEKIDFIIFLSLLAILMTSLLFWTLTCFKKLKKIKSICQTNS